MFDLCILWFFDTVEHFAIFEALRKTNVNETYINILQNIYI